MSGFSPGTSPRGRRRNRSPAPLADSLASRFKSLSQGAINDAIAGSVLGTLFGGSTSPGPADEDGSSNGGSHQSSPVRDSRLQQQEESAADMAAQQQDQEQQGQREQQQEAREQQEQQRMLAEDMHVQRQEQQDAAAQQPQEEHLDMQQQEQQQDQAPALHGAEANQLQQQEAQQQALELQQEHAAPEQQVSGTSTSASAEQQQPVQPALLLVHLPQHPASQEEDFGTPTAGEPSPSDLLPPAPHAGASNSFFNHQTASPSLLPAADGAAAAAGGGGHSWHRWPSKGRRPSDADSIDLDGVLFHSMDTDGSSASLASMPSFPGADLPRSDSAGSAMHMGSAAAHALAMGAAGNSAGMGDARGAPTSAADAAMMFPGMSAVAAAIAAADADLLAALGQRLRPLRIQVPAERADSGEIFEEVVSGSLAWHGSMSDAIPDRSCTKYIRLHELSDWCQQNGIAELIHCIRVSVRAECTQ